MRNKQVWLKSAAFALIAATFFALRPTDGAEPAPGKQVAASSVVKVTADDGSVRDATLRYLLYLPPEYGVDEAKRWPLVLFLHGSGERGDDLEKVKVHGPPKLVAAKPDLPVILVSPQCPADSRWNAAELAKLVEDLANTYRVDRQRLYVTGLSMGGAGTWSLLAECPGKSSDARILSASAFLGATLVFSSLRPAGTADSTRRRRRKRKIRLSVGTSPLPAVSK